MALLVPVLSTSAPVVELTPNEIVVAAADALVRPNIGHRADRQAAPQDRDIAGERVVVVR